MTKVLLGTTGLAALMLAGAAQAADMPLKAPPPAAVGLYNWNGFYIGAHVGGSWGTVESEVPFPGGGAFPVSSHTINGFLGGGQAGYNWQVNQWLVLGVEGQFSWTNLEGSTPCVLLFKCTTEVNWLATVAGRVGYTFDRTMLYVKAGGAWADTDYSISLLGLSSISTSDTRTGFMLGAGIEYGFLQNWSVKLEYNYLDFDTDSFGFGLGGGCQEAVLKSASVCRDNKLNADITQRIHLIKAGLNYRFNWGAPISARY